MKLKKTLSAFSLIAVAASTLATGPAAFASTESPVDTSAESGASVTALDPSDRLGTLVATVPGSSTFYSAREGLIGSLGLNAHASLAEASAASTNVVLPEPGTAGPVKNAAGECAFTRLGAGVSFYHLSMDPAHCAYPTNFEWVQLVRDGKPIDVLRAVNGTQAGRYVGVTEWKPTHIYMTMESAAQAAALSGTAVVPSVPYVTVATGVQPTLAAGAEGDATVTLTNERATATPHGMEFEVHAPTGTTFKDRNVAWTYEGGPNGAFSGALSEDKKTITVSRPAANIRPSATMTLAVKLVAAAGQVGEHNDGALTFTFTGAVPAGTTASIGWKAAEVLTDVTLSAPAIDAVLQDARPVFSGAGQNGATIEVVEGDNVIATATVSGGTWTATPDADMPVGAHAGSVNQKISGTPQSSTPFSFTREAVVVEQPLVVTSPAVGGSIVTDETGRVAPVFSGTATPGAEVKVVTAWADVVGTTTADATTGAWSLTWNKTLLPNTYGGGSTIQSIGGKVIDRVGYNFTVTGSITQEPLVVTSPAVNGTIEVGPSGTVAPVFSGTATPGADVKVVTAWNDTVGTVKADATTGAWSITWNKSLKPAVYAGGNTIQSINGVEIDRAGYRFTVQAAASDVVLSSPAIGGIISTGGAPTIAPVFTGTGTEGARIEIVGAWGTDLGKGVVKDGVWEITWANQYTPSNYSGGLVKQYLEGQSTLHSSVPYNFTITNTPEVETSLRVVAHNPASGSYFQVNQGLSDASTTRFDSLSEARDSSTSWTVVPTEDGWYQLKDPTNSAKPCLIYRAFTHTIDNGACDSARAEWKLTAGDLVNRHDEQVRATGVDGFGTLRMSAGARALVFVGNDQ